MLKKSIRFLFLLLLLTGIPAAASADEFSYSLNNGVLTISCDGNMPEYSFGGAPWYSSRSRITGVVFQGNVTSIGSYAFFGCSGLTDITIPDSVRSIGWWAFSGCSGLTSVTLPGSVSSIDGYAFYNCSSLFSLMLPAGITSIDSGAFSGCSGLSSLSIPSGITSIDSYTFSGCTSLTSVSIPDSVTSIGSYAFAGCSGLTSVEIPDSVASIGRAAFYGCSGLTSITLSGAELSIETKAFYSCTALKTIYLTGSALSQQIINNADLPAGAALHCSSYQYGISLPARAYIEEEAFYGNPAIRSVYIPDSCSGIGANAFCGCTNLTLLRIPEGLTADLSYLRGSAVILCGGETARSLAGSLGLCYVAEG